MFAKECAEFEKSCSRSFEDVLKCLIEENFSSIVGIL
jgi:hypothetical protein